MKTPITVAYGDGIGPEIMEATLSIILAAGAEIEPYVVEIGEKVYLKGIPTGMDNATWDVIRKTKAFLKAPITTPQGGGFKSLNVTIRTTLGLYANVRPCVSYHPFVDTKHPVMDVVIIRENEEDLYAGIEYQQSPDVCCSIKLISRAGSEKIIRYAFEYAKHYGRKKVTCFSKDNIMKFSDGLFHRVFDEIAQEYPDIINEHWIVDIGAAKLADTPEVFDVVVMPNLYGDILSDVAAQITGSVGIAGSANIGDHGAMFEAIHGSAPRRAGQNLANPSGLLLAAVQMLVHIGQPLIAQKVHNAWLATMEQGIHTYDLFVEGKSFKKVGTKEFAQAVIANLEKKPETLAPVTYSKGYQATSPKLRQTSPNRQLKGVDVFIYHRGKFEDFFAKVSNISIGNMKLKLITNRGAQIWPNGHKETFCTEQWRCRFVSIDATLPGGTPGASTGGQTAGGTPGSTPAAGGAAAPGTPGGAVTGGAAPAGGGAAAPGTPGGSPAPVDGPLTASDRGVTESTIRVGFTIVDLGPARQAGEAINFASPEVQQGWWQAAVDEVNNAGGVNGRQIEPVYQSVNVLDSAQAQAACVHLTEDEQVFGVVGVLYFPIADECVVTGHDTPLSTIGPNDDATYASGRLVTLMPRTSRVIAQFGGDLNQQGMLAGRNVGILGDAGSDPRGDAMRQLEGLVQEGNPASVRTATLGTDLASAAAQTGLVVNNWRSAGVDTVIFIVNPSYGLAFVQNADRQFWKPAYLASDFANMGNNDVATVGMSEGYDGALAITTTSVGREPNAALASCLDVLARNGHPVEDPEQSGLAGQQCDMLNAFLAGARGAGANLTRDTFAQGIQAAGSVDMWRVGGGSYGQGKFDLADLVTTVRWGFDCGCYEPQTEFRQGTA